MAPVCVLLAPGFEEIEAVSIIDVLRRASVETVVLGVEGKRVDGAHGITVEADSTLAERSDDLWEIVILPGGTPGSVNLRDSEAVQALLRRQSERQGKLAAICAAPIALSAAGVLEGRLATSYPSFSGQLSCAGYVDDAVVVDGPVTTSRGPGTAMAFALRLVAQLRGEKMAAELAAGMLVAT